MMRIIRKLSRPKPTSHSFAWVLLGIISTGFALSMLLTQDTKWANWHLSRLGEGNSTASFIFNGTMVLAAMVLILLATRIADEMSHRHNSRGARRLQAALVMVAICLVGVGAFPFDKFPVIHNIFGYGQFFVLSGLILTLRAIYPHFRERTYISGYVAVGITMLLMVLFHLTHFTTLLIVELIGQLLAYAWVLSITRDMAE